MIVYKNTAIHYIIQGKGAPTTVFLHGWGGSIESFEAVGKNFDGTKVYVDFPPFGKSGEPAQPWQVCDYADLVKNILDSKKIKSANFVCHSFGGRVGIYLASTHPNLVEKLVLTAGAGIKPRRGVKYRFKVFKSKIYKLFKIKKPLGSKDYQALSPTMRQTFKNIVNLDLKNYAKKISCPTLLFWGMQDTETPLYMAKKLKKLIKDSGLVAYKNCGHFCYLEKFKEFVIITKKFIGA